MNPPINPAPTPEANQTQSETPASTDLSETDLNAMFQGALDGIMEQVNAKIDSLRLNQTSQTPEAQNDTERTTLTQRMAQLEAELQRRDKEAERSAREQRYNKALDTGLEQYDLAYPNETRKLVSLMMASQVKEIEGKWLDSNGKTLEESISGFFSTPFGQHLLKAPNVNPGSGTVTPNRPRTGNEPNNSIGAINKLFGF